MNLLITKDEKDVSLGIFFEKCAAIALSLFKDSANIEVLSSQKLKNNVIFSMTVNNESFKPFNFFAFTHGNEDGLISDNQNYVGCDTDGSCWENANIVYNYSCLSGCLFGKFVVENGAKSFVGHNKTIFIQTLPKYQDYFYNPLITFLTSLARNENVETCVKMAKNKYTEEIDELYLTDMFTASVLMENRDSLVCYGDMNAKIVK